MTWKWPVQNFKISLEMTEKSKKNMRYRFTKIIVSVSVYYVAVRTIVLSRHGSNLARPVIIHDISHGLIYCGPG